VKHFLSLSATSKATENFPVGKLERRSALRPLTLFRCFNNAGPSCILEVQIGTPVEICSFSFRRCRFASGSSCAGLSSLTDRRRAGKLCVAELATTASAAGETPSDVSPAAEAVSIALTPAVTAFAFGSAIRTMIVTSRYVTLHTWHLECQLDVMRFWYPFAHDDVLETHF